MKHSFFCKIMLICAIFFGSAQHTYADKPEYQVKALSLVLFLKYVSFTDNSPFFKIGVVGDNPFNGQLKKFDGATLKGRTIKIHFFKKDANQAANANCHFYFISKSEVLKQDAIIKKLSKPNNLVFGDNKWFLKAGGMINLHLLKDEVRWDSNKKLIDKKSLKVDYQIYDLSTNRGESP